MLGESRDEPNPIQLYYAPAEYQRQANQRQGQLRHALGQRQPRDAMMARITDHGAVSDAFAVTNGLKQGCALAPTFCLIFFTMLMDTYRDERPGIYRIDDQLLNSQRREASTLCFTNIVHDLLGVEDCTLKTATE
ncbi:unnamed protein product [Schistocephalus solidus]|uniref:Reverse transcriptase domain-containing protein n=1 Tax=Schistocephalus solidus TaxID=70667 RepID=A0A183TAI4_SCHSO|nr:unnamed protein product [Schistocephalus solidus]